jgi:methionyl-tRNA formyltransferase
MLTITVLTDAADSWYVPYGRRLAARLGEEHDVAYVHRADEVRPGDVCFLLSCTRIVSPAILARNTNNIVVHASDLPEGKGFSPLQWQIVEGVNDITLTLFEAAAALDAGPYYLKERLRFEGHELLDELRAAMALAINRMCIEYIARRRELAAVPQCGQESFFRRRTRKDDELDPSRPLAELFNQLRVADNERYPAHFQHAGHRYEVKIYKADPPAGQS